MATNGHTKGICTIPDCTDPVHYVHLQVCKACYAGLSNWRNRSAEDKRHRRELNLRLLSRMDFILTHPAHHPEQRK
jgi:hypothetical protein